MSIHAYAHARHAVSDHYAYSKHMDVAKFASFHDNNPVNAKKEVGRSKRKTVEVESSISLVGGSKRRFWAPIVYICWMGRPNSTWLEPPFPPKKPSRRCLSNHRLSNPNYTFCHQYLVGKQPQAEC